MKLTIKGTNIKLSDSIYKYIDIKINELEKFIQNVGGSESQLGQPTIEGWVEVERTRKGDRSGDVFRAEAQIKLPGVSGIRAESTQWDLHQAIDEVKNELQRQLKKYKRKKNCERRQRSKARERYDALFGALRMILFFAK